MRHAKAVNIIDLHNQLTWAYNAIISKLVKDIDSLDENTSTMIFLKNLKIKKNTWHRIYNRKLFASRTKFEFFYQINFSSSANFSYDQFNQTYTSRQYRQSFENVSETRTYQKFQSNDNAYQKNKTSQRSYEISEEFNQNTQTSFETQQVRNQTIFAWRQNAS
jgi:hypothetical protein